MTRKRGAPGVASTGRPAAEERLSLTTNHPQHTTTRQGSASPEVPFAYRCRKAGRGNGWPVVAKLTRFSGGQEPVLAVTWRNQRGTERAISLPRAVLLDARNRGANWVYLRDDNRLQMRRCSIEAFMRGWLQPDGEHYVLLADMEAVPWQWWEYAARELTLTQEPVAAPPPPEPSVPVQLTLFGATL